VFDEELSEHDAVRLSRFPHAIGRPGGQADDMRVNAALAESTRRKQNLAPHRGERGEKGPPGAPAAQSS